MKNTVVITKVDDKINFYLLSAEYGRKYLFTSNYSKGVYEYFRKGRSENELRTYRSWNRNPRLDKSVGRVIIMSKYVEKEAAGEYEWPKLLKAAGDYERLK